MRDIMTQTGWTEIDSNTNLAVAHLNLSPPEKVHNGNQWKLDVQQKNQELLDLRTEHIPTSTETSTDVTQFIPNQVRVVDKSYLERTSSNHSVSDQMTLDTVVHDFNLNCEQERAFRIVANHVSNPYSEQLKMYIGGMGGTGKTQVLKSLMQFFKLQKQLHSFVIVAPTGSAAALSAGSTYHSFCGFNDRSDDKVSILKLAQVVRATLDS